MGDPPKVRGLSLIHWLAAFDRLHGAEARLALVEGLPEATRDAIGRGLRDDDWYPLAWWGAMLAGARAQIADELTTIEALARSSATSEFSTVHRILLLFVTPQHLLRISRRVFSRYYDHGSVESMPTGRREAQVRWGGCRGFDENIWHDCFTAAAVAVEQCGARDVSWQLVTGGGDDDLATVQYRWR